MKIQSTNYGKDFVRLAVLTRRSTMHFFVEMCLSIRLKLSNNDAFTQGNNADVVATDTMKNFAAIHLASMADNFSSPIDFAASLSRAIEKRYKQVVHAEVQIEETEWQRMKFKKKVHPHCFFKSGKALKPKAKTTKDGALELSSGFTGLSLLKTTESGFADFSNCSARTLVDTKDRVLATSVNAFWQYKPDIKNYSVTKFDQNVQGGIEEALFEVFANEYSPSVQHTMNRFAEDALDICDEISSLKITMPNLHYIPWNGKPFGIEHENTIFIPTREPYGVIEGTFTQD